MTKFFSKEFNIGFHMPKKDKCSICTGFKINEATGEQKKNYEKHVHEKDLIKKHYLMDQKKSNLNGYVCASFDTQKVSSTPHGESDMRIFYYNRYSVYNETVYEGGTQNGFFFIWGEGGGKRGANEVSTVLFKYLQLLDSRRLS
ncbi:hypothetical protein NQ314_007089 [Rhamnusium bicolor]|uniref:Uncharacterized protein n=1 Tax=Rhamnusium bicolor TaxID=1586634 RepID=A0AAV8YTU4_9CUCU|nr:hypothetical protein NQ314_007089 [Rhamnusium bicolor]